MQPPRSSLLEPPLFQALNQASIFVSKIEQSTYEIFSILVPRVNVICGDFQ